jgi:hypothetical protein
VGLAAAALGAGAMSRASQQGANAHKEGDYGIQSQRNSGKYLATRNMGKNATAGLFVNRQTLFEHFVPRRA